MKKDAEEHASEDAKKKELIDTRNIAEQLVYTAEKSLKDYGDKVTAEIKSDIEAKIKLVNEAKTGENLENIKSATDALNTALQKIGEVMNQAADSTPSGTDTDGPVRDADVQDGQK